MNTTSAEFLANKAGQTPSGVISENNTPASGPEMIGAEMLVHALHAEGVEYVWGYPGGAVLFIYDETLGVWPALFAKNSALVVFIFPFPLQFSAKNCLGGSVPYLWSGFERHRRAEN
jgi:hypothetical protein